MQILAVNSGSSSFKFKLLELGDDAAAAPGAGAERSSGTIEEIGGRARLTLLGAERLERQAEVRSHADAARWMLDHLESGGARDGGVRIEAVGHRVVHGGETFREPVLLDEEVIQRIGELNELAPLHNPACLEGIRALREVLGPAVPMVAVFDTAFHRSMPDRAASYAIARELAERHHIRRYGFHGLAHASVAAGFAAWTGAAPEGLRLITVHLGNGCSMAAIRAGRSVDTSMGFTPLEGLVMGTRSGDLDPAVVGYLARKERVAVERVEEWLNEGSGLLGVSGVSRDMRRVLAAAEEERNPDAMRAVDLFCYRVKKYIGAYLAALGGADAVVFSGGIGERAPAIRARSCEGMDWCGLRLDPERNAAVSRVDDGSPVLVSVAGTTPAAYVMRVDEESWIARETLRCLTARKGA